MIAPDLHDELRQLRQAGMDAGAEIERLTRHLAARRPDTVKSLHDTKAHLAYVRLMLRTVQQELAALLPPIDHGAAERR